MRKSGNWMDLGTCRDQGQAYLQNLRGATLLIFFLFSFGVSTDFYSSSEES